MKKKGWAVYSETLASALALDGSHYFNSDWDHAAGYVNGNSLDINPLAKEYLFQ